LVSWYQKGSTVLDLNEARENARLEFVGKNARAGK